MTTDIYTRSADIPRVDPLNGFTATNLGDTTVTVNGKTLFPSTTPLTDQGDSYTFGGNEGEAYVGKIIVAFVLPLGATPKIEIVQKYYINDKRK